MYEELSDEVERLLAMAGGVKDAIFRRNADVPRLIGELAALEGNTCTGREWWRDRNHPSRDPKLYINHSIDQACPLHGEPGPSERLRVYVGNHPGKIEEARAAMGREALRHELERSLEATRRSLVACSHSLQRFYDYLGYGVRDDGLPEARR